MAELNYYDILGVKPTATADEIKEAWEVKRKIHPDYYQKDNQKKYAEAQFQLVSNAHDVLKDPAKRQKYDDSLRQTRSQPPHQSERRQSPQPETPPHNTEYEARARAQAAAEQAGAQTITLLRQEINRLKHEIRTFRVGGLGDLLHCLGLVKNLIIVQIVYFYHWREEKTYNLSLFGRVRRWVFGDWKRAIVVLVVAYFIVNTIASGIYAELHKPIPPTETPYRPPLVTQNPGTTPTPCMTTPPAPPGASIVSGPCNAAQ
jgi:hypothetical protein